MLYRYGYRVLPYGDSDDDWLSLDEVAFSASGFKLNRQQIIGRVLLHTAHSELSEQTNRQGLIASETFDVMQNILSWVVHVEIRELIKAADKIEHIERRKAEQDSGIADSVRKRVETALERCAKKRVKMRADRLMSFQRVLQN